MRVLYVQNVESDERPSPMDELAVLEPSLEVHTAAGAAAALVEIRARGGYRAVFLSPRLPHNEALALVATLRRDRAPVAIVAIITESQRQFFAPAMTAGADDVLVLRDEGLTAADDTLRRVRDSRHLERRADQPALQVLYVGQDDLARDLLSDTPFVNLDSATASVDGTVPLAAESSARPDVIVVDEQPGEGHALQVVKWLKAQAPEIPVVALTSAMGHEIGGAALELGADDVVSKTGTYRRRLVAILHRIYVRRQRIATAPERVEPVALSQPSEPEPFEPVEPEDLGTREPGEADDESEDIARMRQALAFEEQIRDLSAEVNALRAELDAQRRGYDELQESQGFERAMRDRDREELARLHQALNEERERRIVLEGTLRQTEDRISADSAAIEARHADATRDLEAQLADAQGRLEQAKRESEMLQHAPFGWATVALDGTLVRCNTAFPRLFGYDGEADALAAGTPFPGLPDHAHVVEQLQAGTPVIRVESVLHRADGRPFRALTSAVLSTGTDERPATVDRLVIDLDDRARLEEQLRLARRLEAAGRLAAEMSSEIDPVLAAIDNPVAPEGDRRRAALLVRQLLAFSRHQAKPAGQLSLSEAVRRAEPTLRQVAGDLVTFELHLGPAGSITASEDDVEQLLAALVFAAAGSLPYGGTVSLETRMVRAGFDQRTELTVAASGYGVHPASISSSLTRLVTKCGGAVHTSDDPARHTTLHVNLPC